MIRRRADRPDFLAPFLHHEFSCASRGTLVAAYIVLSDAPWVESCCVDLPRLRLALRLSAAARRPMMSSAEWLRGIERVARGLSAKR